MLSLALAAGACSPKGGSLSEQEALRLRYAQVLARPADGQNRSATEAQCDAAGVTAQRGAYPEAVAAYEAIVSGDPGALRARYHLGRMYLRTGRHGLAAAQLEAVVAQEPRFADAHFWLGVAYAQRAPIQEAGSPSKVRYDDLDKAIEQCRTAADLEPTNPLFQQNLGRALRLRLRQDEAAAAYRRALELDEGAAEAHWRLGEILSEQPGQGEEALTHLRRAATLDSANAEIVQALGAGLERLDRLDEAAEAYRRAVRLQPERPAYRLALGKVLHRLGQGAQSDLELRRFQELEARGGDPVQQARLAVQQNPGAAAAHRVLALAYADQGRFALAAEELRVALALTPNDAAGHCELGVICARLDQMGPALEALKRAVALAPDSARFHLRLAQAYARVGEAGAAEGAFRHAAALDPELVQPRLELAALYIQGGRSAEALPLLDAILAQDPGHLEARYNRGLAHLAAGRTPEAVRDLGAVAAARPDHPAARLLQRLREKGPGRRL